MKPTVFTNGTTDYKIMKLNDERIADRYATVVRYPGDKLWRVILTFRELKRAEKSLEYLIKLYDCTMKT